MADLIGTRIIGRVLGVLTMHLAHQVELGWLRPMTPARAPAPSSRRRARARAMPVLRTRPRQGCAPVARQTAARPSPTIQ
jgi:hypothetical protein